MGQNFAIFDIMFHKVV